VEVSNRDLIHFTKERTLDRRQLLRLAAATSVAAVSVGQAGEVRAQEVFEQGDEQCRILWPLVKPTVELTEDNPKQFIAVSQILTRREDFLSQLSRPVSRALRMAVGFGSTGRRGQSRILP
jgi:hypothetical protein